ncbi:linear amide C-N hydrolase, partial [Roseibium sp. RKSG952]|uniref:linear amide C-N hydrolase n=1 Tax=Roseibium sp. RKSG952 TaxID=2529384 RepID=UPI0012BB4D61
EQPDWKPHLAPGDFLYWALSNFETVESVKQAIENKEVSIVGVILPELEIIPPFHYTLHDRTGQSIVVEPVDGVLKVYDNPVGILTNSPDLPWQLINLTNYVNLSPVNAGDGRILKQVIPTFSQGSGWVGLPGDPTPSSRFLRVASMVATANTGASAEDALSMAQHILNNFDIPKGWIRPGAADPDPESDDEISSENVRETEQPVPSGPAPDEDYTQWSVMADLQNKTYYIRSKDAMAFSLAGFNETDWTNAKPAKDASGVLVLELTASPDFVPLNEQQSALMDK